MDEIMSDILKLNLESKLSNEASEPISDLIKSKNIKIENIHMDNINNDIIIDLESHSKEDYRLLQTTTEVISDTLYNSLSQYIY